MPRWITVAFTLFLTLHVLTSQAKTVDEVIDNCIKTMGRNPGGLHDAGHARLKSVRSVPGYGPGARLPGYRYPTFTSQCTPEVLAIPFTAKVQTLPAIAPLPLTQANDYDATLADYAARGYRATLTGTAYRHGNRCYQVQLVSQSGFHIHYFIHADSWRIVQVITGLR